MYWRPCTQTVSLWPLGGVGLPSEADRTNPFASEFGGLMMLGQLDERDHGEHHEDQRRSDGPADLEPGVAVDLGRDSALLGPELVDRVDQRAFDDHEHDRREVQGQLVKVVDLVRVRRAARLRGQQVGQRVRRQQQRADRRQNEDKPKPAAPAVGHIGSQGRGILSRRRVPWSGVGPITGQDQEPGRTYTGRSLRLARGIRPTAWALVAAGVAAPLLRRRCKLAPGLVLGTSGAAPFALCVAMPRSRLRDAGVCALNMWAYLAAYEMPHDDPERLAARVRVSYPIAIDRALGLGVPPTLRLQRAFSTPHSVNRFERVLVWCHWIWFFIPHASVGYVVLRRREQFPRAAARMYAVFDLGAVFYWVDPHGAAVVGSGSWLPGGRPRGPHAPDDDRVRRAVLG